MTVLSREIVESYHAADFLRNAPTSPSRDIQVTPLSCYRDDKWIFPRGWVPPSAVPVLLFSLDVPEGLVELQKCYAFLLLRGYSDELNNRVAVSPGTLRGYVYALRRLIIYVIGQGFTSLREVPSNVYEDYIGKKRSKGMQKHLVNCLRHLTAMGELKLIADWPHRLGEEVNRTYDREIFDDQSEEGKILPIPDNELLKLVNFARFVVAKLADPCIEFAERAAALKRDFLNESTRNDKNSMLLKSITWPVINDNSVILKDYPPLYIRQAHDLHFILFASLYTLIAVNTGLRVSELLGLRPNCLSPAQGGPGRFLMNTRTYKSTKDITGFELSFPIVQDAAEAIKVLEKWWVAEDRDPSAFLFPKNKLGGGDPSVLQVNNNLKHLCELSGIPSVTSHQFRKSLARLVALAVTSAPETLCALWGHASPDETIAYMMALPNMAADLEAATGELYAGRGKRLFESADECGGGAAVGVRRAVALAKATARYQQTDPVDQFTTQLIRVGVKLDMIYPNVMCLKAPFQSGQCAPGSCDAVRSNCKENCHFHIELPEAKPGIRKTVEHFIARLSDQQLLHNLLLSRQIARDLLGILPIFPDIEAEYRDHPIVEKARMIAEPGR